MVRNFYARGSADGRASNIEGGPRARDGGLSLRITQRDRGSIVDAFRIESRATSDGHLVTEVVDAAGQVVASKVTER
jgi:hypothetical protein